MSWFPCPVCDHKNAPGVIRCTSCGADFHDPDLIAMMGDDAGPILAPEIGAGSLSHGRFLGVSKEGLEHGGAVRRIALFGVLLLVAGFLIPISYDYDHTLAAWKAFDHAPSIALMFPALAVLLGLVAFFAPLEAWQRSTTLLIAGIIGLGTLPFLGGLSGSPEKFMPVIILGVVVGSWGLILRTFGPQSDLARRVAIVGAVIAVIGFFIPMSDSQNALPIELRFYLNNDLGSGSPFSAYKSVFNKDPMVFFSIVYLFLPMVLLPAGAALSWVKPKEAWDKAGMIVRPLAWIAVVYVPVGFALFAFNLLGSEEGRVVIDNHYMKWEDFTSAALTGRFRLLLLAAAFSTWATLPIVGVAKHFFAESGKPPESDR